MVLNSIPPGLAFFLYETVGYRLRLFTLIPCGDEILLHDLDFRVKISPPIEDEGKILQRSIQAFPVKSRVKTAVRD